MEKNIENAEQTIVEDFGRKTMPLNVSVSLDFNDKRKIDGGEIDIEFGNSDSGVGDVHAEG